MLFPCTVLVRPILSLFYVKTLHGDDNRFWISVENRTVSNRLKTDQQSNSISLCVEILEYLNIAYYCISVYRTPFFLRVRPQRHDFLNPLFWFVCLMVFNALFNNISVISWLSILLVEETRGCCISRPDRDLNPQHQW